MHMYGSLSKKGWNVCTKRGFKSNEARIHFLLCIDLTMLLFTDHFETNHILCINIYISIYIQIYESIVSYPVLPKENIECQGRR